MHNFKRLRRVGQEAAEMASMLDVPVYWFRDTDLRATPEGLQIYPAQRAECEVDVVDADLLGGAPGTVHYFTDYALFVEEE